MCLEEFVFPEVRGFSHRSLIEDLGGNLRVDLAGMTATGSAIQAGSIGIVGGGAAGPQNKTSLGKCRVVQGYGARLRRD